MSTVEVDQAISNLIPQPFGPTKLTSLTNITSSKEI